MEELSTHIQSYGLEPSFWLQKLKKHGVNSVNSFADIKSDMTKFSNLKGQARDEHEKKALHKLFGIAEVDPKADTRVKEKRRRIKFNPLARTKHAEKEKKGKKQELAEQEEPSAHKIIHEAKSGGKQRQQRVLKKPEIKKLTTSEHPLIDGSDNHGSLKENSREKQNKEPEQTENACHKIRSGDHPQRTITPASKPAIKQQPLQPLKVENPNPNSLRNVLTTSKQLSTRVSEYHTVTSSDNPNALALLKCLKLWKCYPKGLQLQNALCIKPEPLNLSLGKETMCPHDFTKLSGLILHKLMAYDSLCRSHLLPAVTDDSEAIDSDKCESEEEESSLDSESDSNSDECESEIFKNESKKSQRGNKSDENPNGVTITDNRTDVCQPKENKAKPDCSKLEIESKSEHKLRSATSGFIKSDNHSDGNSDSNPDDNQYDSDDSFESCPSLTDGEHKIPSEIHPVDCLISLIICSDDFLRQDLFSRLAKCQLAVPFILPDPFTKELTLPLWGLRSIIKEWDCTKADGEIVKITQPIISYKMAIVSFIRLGKHQENGRSKSAILNEVISDSHYDHFFHRDCKGGEFKLVLGEGLVDMCWYLPAGKTSDAFPDAVTFLNLHGDARDHPRQTRFLSQISSMCFVLLTEEKLELDDETKESLKQFGSSPGGITVLGSIEIIPKSLKKKAIIDLKKKNVAGIKDAIRNRIKNKLDRSILFRSIDDCSRIEDTAILIDEHSTSYKEGLSRATKVKALILSNNSENTASKTKQGAKQSGQSSAKDAFLPLQGETLWKSWAINDKEVQRQIQRGNKSVNDYTEEIKSKKTTIRKKQQEQVESLTPVMKWFIVSLLELGGPSNRILRNYFLQCLKLELNNLSRESISVMQQQYQSARKDLSILQESQNADANKIKSLKKKLEDLQEDIISSSFGLEHLLRELGQVYEAVAPPESQLYGDSLCRLPKAAAELLIDGYPLELMDGDAAHVPLKWVTAVLQETADMLGNPNVFVLSVLGLQSTGKSTMLNTAFGLQFNVSAGRCTRGAFMQLLPLDEEIRKETKYRYVLVIDTEGLRAPELDPLKTQKHDNELATFVIGLANMTLINIYGEVPGDMDDILQTTVHAFLRMTRIKFCPSCQFVHQNAGASVSSDVGRAKFTAKLNQFTIEAAKEEKCEKKFTCFNDVIKFNDQTDVHHFPGLWKGDPPMAPINQGYSHSAQMLKLNLIRILHKRSAHSSSEEATNDFHLSAFNEKVKDLWAALLKENFVFSFKNTQEITAYNSLETEYSKWDWEIREAMLKWEQEAENEISAVEVKFAHDLAERKCKELFDHMSSLHNPIKEKMKLFFEGKQSEILVQWKTKFEKRLENLLEELRTHAERHCRKLGKNRQAILEFEQERKRFAAVITQQVHDYIATMKIDQEKFNESLNKGELNLTQLKEVLERELFTHETLVCYQDQGLITEVQVKDVQTIIDECHGQLNTESLQQILFGGILGLEQVEKIVTKGRQSEQELAAKFNDIWDKIIEMIIPAVPMDTVNVEHEVEQTLIEYARARGYEGQLIEIFEGGKKTLRGLGEKLELIPSEKTHYTKVTTVVQKVTTAVAHLIPWGKAKSTTDAHLIEALKVTEKVFDIAKKRIKLITEQKTDFKQTFTQKLLRLVDNTITEESEKVKDVLMFTHDYRCVVFTTVCGHAVPEFERMAKSFMERTNPQIYLEKHQKKPLFTKFKNQYHQTKAEEAIASTLCAHFEVPIKDQIKQTIGAIMVRQMKASDHHFTSKMALKVKVLTDLHDEDDYESYMVYVKNVKKCLQRRLWHYTIQYCDSKLEENQTRLQISVKNEVSRLITVVKNTVDVVNNKEIQEWLTTFSKDQKLVSQLGNIDVDNLLTGYDSLNEINLENFKLQIRSGLRELEENMHASYAHITCERGMVHWNPKPHELLQDLIGCTEQCPFCGEQCDLRDPEHYTAGEDSQKHRTETHRPSCLAGWRNSKTKVMTSDFCDSLVASKDRTFKCKKTEDKPHLYNKYDEIYPEWSIPPDPTAESCLYWKMFVGSYNDELANTYTAEPAEIPDGWLEYEWSEVEDNLKEAYKT